MDSGWTTGVFDAELIIPKAQSPVPVSFFMLLCIKHDDARVCFSRLVASNCSAVFKT